MEPARGTVEAERTAVLNKVAGKVGAKRGEWRSYNGNIKATAHIANLPKIEELVIYILKSFYEFNSKHPGHALTAVPVSGWLSNVPTEGIGGFLSCFGTKEMSDRVAAEYGASYSFNYFISTIGADMILLISRSAHYILPVKGKPDQYKVSAGVQVTEFDDYLRKRGLAAPSSSTIHRVAWTGGTGTGFYWPSKVDGPGSTHVLKAKVIDGKGNKIKLSPKNKHRPDLFHATIHAHLGAAYFVTELRIGGIEKNYLVKRTNTLYKNITDFKKKTAGVNLLDKESFLFQYFPFDAADKGVGNQIRVTISERTQEVPSDATKVRPYVISDVWKKLMITEASEGIIGLITDHEELRMFYPTIVRAAAFDTFGSDEHTVEVGDVGTIMHPFPTYTDQEMSDVNPCILAKTTAVANEIFHEILSVIDEFYKETKGLNQFNIVARLVKGIPDPEGIRGIAACIVDNPGEFKLAFEVLEHEKLAQTDSAKELRRRIFRKIAPHQFVLHHGKTPVEGLETLEKQFSRTDLTKKRLAGYRQAITELGGDNTSTLLTNPKRQYIFSSDIEPKAEKERPLIAKQKEHEKPLDKAQKKKALEHVIELSKEDPEMVGQATKMLAGIN